MGEDDKFNMSGDLNKTMQSDDEDVLKNMLMMSNSMGYSEVQIKGLREK